REDLAVGGQRLVVVRQLLLARQMAVPEEEDRLLERRVLDELVDVEAAVEQSPFAAVDETDLGSRDDDVFEAGFPYGAHGSPACRCEKAIGFYHSSRGPSRQGARPIELYDRHPIDETHVRAAAARRRPGGRLAATDLFDFDQDHYGGVQAVEILARRAAVHPSSRVLDVCAGLGGPARFLASGRGCRVVGVEL